MDITITWDTPSWHCEDCGTVYNKEMRLEYVTPSGVPKTLRLSEDGHFGNTADFHEPEVLVKTVLEFLGHNVNLLYIKDDGTCMG